VAPLEAGAFLGQTGRPDQKAGLETLVFPGPWGLRAATETLDLRASQAARANGGPPA